MIVKEIEEYNIPDGYKSIILDFYEKTLKLLDSKLLLFLIGRKLWKRIGPWRLEWYRYINSIKRI